MLQIGQITVTKTVFIGFPILEKYGRAVAIINEEEKEKKS
jgi:hypothetical protein